MIRPDFCTTVFPDEYNWVEQFEEAVKAANKYHTKNHNECPPPYFPFDIGKLYGIVVELQKYKEAEKAGKIEWCGCEPQPPAMENGCCSKCGKNIF